MSIKTAVANIPMGGGKGGVRVNPKELTQSELKQLSKKFVAKIANVIGEDIDIPAPDVNTNSTIMKWMLEEFELIQGKKEPAAFTGKAVADKRVQKELQDIRKNTITLQTPIPTQPEQ